MSNYSKLIGALLGNIVAILIAWAAVNFPSIAQCTVPTGAEDQVCTVLSFTQTQITAALMVIVNAAFVYFFPANKPS